jgi:hypothetical protein
MDAAFRKTDFYYFVDTFEQKNPQQSSSTTYSMTTSRTTSLATSLTTDVTILSFSKVPIRVSCPPGFTVGYLFSKLDRQLPFNDASTFRLFVNGSQDTPIQFHDTNLLHTVVDRRQPVTLVCMEDDANDANDADDADDADDANDARQPYKTFATSEEVVAALCAWRLGGRATEDAVAKYGCVADWDTSAFPHIAPPTRLWGSRLRRPRISDQSGNKVGRKSVVCA